MNKPQNIHKLKSNNNNNNTNNYNDLFNQTRENEDNKYKNILKQDNNPFNKFNEKINAKDNFVVIVGKIKKEDDNRDNNQNNIRFNYNRLNRNNRAINNFMLFKKEKEEEVNRNNNQIIPKLNLNMGSQKSNRIANIVFNDLNLKKGASFAKKDEYENYITAIFIINKNERLQNIRIINSYEAYLRSQNIFNFDYRKRNEEDIKECKIQVEGKLIPFSYTYRFGSPGKFKIIYSFKKNLCNLCFLFSSCQNLKRVRFI